MANKYCWSGAGGAATGADWSNAYLTIKAAAEAAGTAAGDSIWVAHDHAETQAVALTITPKNTKAAPGTIACVDRAGSVPPVAADLRTTATVTTTATSSITLSGAADGPTLWQGFTFNCGTGVVAAVIALGAAGIGCVNVFRNCNFNRLATSPTVSALTINAGKVTLINCNIQFGNIADQMAIPGGRFEWLGGAVTGSAPTTLMQCNAASTEAFIRGVDLSLVTGTLCSSLGFNSAHDIKLVNCKLGVGVAGGTQTIIAGGRLFLIDCDSGATNYRTEYYRFGGNQFSETTVVRTGGASDGTTPISWKIVTDANARWQISFESLPIAAWDDTSGVKTVSVYGYWNNASVPNNDDIWIEAEYLGSAGSPVSSFASSGKASFLATNAAIPSDGSAWSSSGFTTFNPSDMVAATLSNANLTATGTSSGGARAVSSASSGKCYFEYTYVTTFSGAPWGGIGLASATFAGSGAGIAFLPKSTGNITINGSVTGSSLGVISAGNVLGVAVDFTSKLIWFRLAPSGNWNGSGSADPATGVGGLSISLIATGPLYPMCTVLTNDVMTANFGASAFTGAVPAGFTAGFVGVGVNSKFKMSAAITTAMKGPINVVVKAAKASSTFYVDPKIEVA